MLLALLLACRPDGRPAGPAGGDDAPPAGEDTGAPASFSLIADDHVALPYASAGQDVPAGALRIEAPGLGSAAPIAVEVEGEFAIEGDLSALSAGEVRELTVRYAGATGEPRIAAGAATLATGGQEARVALAAVIGDPALPPAEWADDSWGTRAVVALPSAPFPYGDAPYDDASVLIFVPAAFSDPGEVAAVTHLHGHNATLEDIVAEQSLVEQHALSGRDAILIAPQGPEEAASGDFGRLMEPGGHADLVRDAVSVLYRDGLLDGAALGEQALTAHSGGYRATAAILEHGGLAVSAVHLFDALYGESAVYEDFARGGGLLRSVYTASGGTAEENQALRADLAAGGVDVALSFADPELLSSDVTIGPSDSSHGGCVSEQRAYARWLAASGLPRSPLAPPELLAVESDGSAAAVSWREDRSPGDARYRVEGSADGEVWETLAETEGYSASVPALPWIRVRSLGPDGEAGDPSDAYGGSGARWLVVDGFDRVLGGSWRRPAHEFAARVGSELGGGFSTASNEAVAEGLVPLDGYDAVVWLLGDEGTADVTFDDAERAAVEAYLDGGGRAVVSGAEVGYATDGGWLEGALGATYIADDAGTTQAGGYTFGVAYPEDYPDVLAGEETIWAYAGGGAAAVGWGGRVAVVGFPLETLADADLAPALGDLAIWLGIAP